MNSIKDPFFSKKKINFSRSIIVKSGILFILILTIVLILSIFLINKKATNTIKIHSQERLTHASNIVEKSFYLMLKEIKNDISLISKNISVERTTNSNNIIDYKNITKFWPIVLSEKPNYFQIRLLSVNDNGKELIKFEKHLDSIHKTPKEKLQFKGSKDYYKNALKVKEPFYFSEVSLNEDYGKITKPLKPTLRAISKLYDQNGNVTFLIIINVDLSIFYEEISQINKQEVKTVIIDSLGDYKYNDDIKNCFGKQNKTGVNFKRKYKGKLESVLNPKNKDNTLVDFDHQKFIYISKKITYSSGINSLYIVSIASKKKIFANVGYLNKYSIYTVFIICIVIFVIFCFYAYYFVLRIRKITSAISSYNDKNFSNTYLKKIIHRKDEIGILALTYLKMKSNIDSNLETIKSSLKREKEAVKDKNEFLQNMSHELRTPLNAILGLVNLLNKNKPSEVQKPIINALERSANNLNGLMHDILDEQRLKEGKISLTFQKTNIDELLQTIVSNYTFKAIKKGLKVNLITDSSLKNKSYLLDSLRFEQIVTNLLVNSIKYTSKGYVSIYGKEKDNQLIIKIVDTGQGIKPENLEKIKTRFYREKNNHITKEEGFGLGLSIVKKIIDLFNGTLEVNSILGQGSTFSFSIPIEEASLTKEPHPNTNYLYPTIIKNCSILHIEDDLSSQILIKNTLESLGITVKSASTKQEANNFLANQQFSLILTDLMLGSTNIITYVNNELYKQKTPVLAFSAFQKTDVKHLKTSLVQKPIKIELLIDSIITNMCSTIYDVPQLHNIYKQYDNNSQKINNYLHILIHEFENYYDRILNVIISKDKEEWKAIKHKIITHVTSLELKNINYLLKVNINEITLNNSIELKNNILYILCYLRNELLLNLKD
ncbi:signal transduction histidine kinase [Maribacter vaceletii]|uniref:histidine kinase n=1 Tax=Maribacter vaceletii TaxID=1206816 RepID=A0A495DWR1_9FLAO|nr:ATP-binding protein [Maribacter vaceletii]RKR08047.1 signal transduction histidine kinase [Maribacter vaceletii]